MTEPKDYSPDGKDRAGWDRAWRAMPLRRLISSPRLPNHYAGFGTLVSTTISRDPAEFSDFAYRESETCSICGVSTVDGEPIAATIHPTWESGLSLSIGVWVHQGCFDSCSLTDQHAPIPW